MQTQNSFGKKKICGAHVVFFPPKNINNWNWKFPHSLNLLPPSNKFDQVGKKCVYRNCRSSEKKKVTEYVIGIYKFDVISGLVGYPGFWTGEDLFFRPKRKSSLCRQFPDSGVSREKILENELFQIERKITNDVTLWNACIKWVKVGWPDIDRVFFLNENVYRRVKIIKKNGCAGILQKSRNQPHRWCY